MRIQCPSCQARANLSAEHEGTKVRCTECGRVYVARPQALLLSERSGKRGLLILGFVGGVALIGFVLLARARPTLPVAEAAPAEIAPLVEDSSSERVREERPQSHEDTPSEARERVDRGPIQIDEEEQRWLERNPDH